MSEPNGEMKLYGLLDDETLDSDPYSACDRIGDDREPGDTFELHEWSTRPPDVIPAADVMLDDLIDRIGDSEDLLDGDVFDRYAEHMRRPEVLTDVETFVDLMRAHVRAVGWRWADERLRSTTVTVPAEGESWLIEWPA